MTTPERIRVASWNCFGSPFDALSFFMGRPFWPERLSSPSVARALASYDLVCIQENLVHHVRERLEALRRAAGFAELWFDPIGPEIATGTYFGGGLAILSRWPIRARFVRLTTGAGPDLYARKGFTVAEVTLPTGSTVRLVNTHLQADYNYLPGPTCSGVRTRQIAELARTLGSPDAAPPPATILCGDLNIPHGTEEYLALVGLLGGSLTDITAEAGLITYDVDRNDIAAAFHEGGAERCLIDYIWVSSDRFAVREVRALLEEPLSDVGRAPGKYRTRAFASDHFAVGATLDLLR